MVGLLPRLGDEAVVRMAGCILQVYRLLAFDNHADKALARVEPDLADGILAQPLCGHQHVLHALGIREIDRGHIHAHGSGDMPDNDIECPIQVRCRIHQLNDAAQDIQHRHSPQDDAAVRLPGQ